MKTLDVTILTDSDEPFVMSILQAMAEKKLIRLDQPELTMVRPGSPLTIGTLNEFIEKSEHSGRVSVEEAKARLGL